MTSNELVQIVPGVDRFTIGPTAITNVVERIRAERGLNETSISDVISAFAVIPSEADIDFAKWYIRWTASRPTTDPDHTNRCSGAATEVVI